jgi:hypothetical protein
MAPGPVRPKNVGMADPDMSDDDRQALNEIHELLSANRAQTAVYLANLEDARQQHLRSPAPPFHRYVTAKVDYDYRIVSLTIADRALAGYDHTELSDIVTDVLRRSTQHMLGALWEQFDELRRWNKELLSDLRDGIAVLLDRSPSDPPECSSERVPSREMFEATSRDGQLRVVVGESAAEHLACHIGPSCLAEGNAPLLAERIVALHTAAVMHAEVASCVKSGLTASHSKADVEAFRRRHITF